MASSLESVFYSKESRLGKIKRDLLLTTSVICPKYAESGLQHRTKWEDLLAFGQIGTEVFAEAMKKAEGGEGPANELLESRADNFMLAFCLNQTSSLVGTYSDYKPEYGFDLDLILVVGNLFDHQQIEVYYEVFPRSQAGQMVTHFASSIFGTSQLRVSEEEKGGPGVIVTPVMGLLQGEGGSRGEGAHDAASRITQWYKHSKGIWPVTGEFLINFFLNRCLASIQTAEGQSVKAGAFHKNFDGRVSDPGVTTLRMY